MVDIRKVIIIFVVAVLFAVLVFAVIDAVYPPPKYEDYCRQESFPKVTPATPKDCTTVNVPTEEQMKCDQQHGYIEYNYDSNGCATGYFCQTCQYEMQQAQEQYDKYVFYISAVLSLIAVFLGLFLPAKANSLNEWIGTGFMLGGTFALFFGTVRSFTSLERFVRPIVIFLELALVIFMSYKKIGNLREDKTKGKNKK